MLSDNRNQTEDVLSWLRLSGRLQAASDFHAAVMAQRFQYLATDQNINSSRRPRDSAWFCYAPRKRWSRAQGLADAVGCLTRAYIRGINTSAICHGPAAGCLRSFIGMGPAALAAVLSGLLVPDVDSQQQLRYYSHKKGRTNGKIVRIRAKTSSGRSIAKTKAQKHGTLSRHDGPHALRYSRPHAETAVGASQQPRRLSGAGCRKTCQRSKIVI